MSPRLRQTVIITCVVAGIAILGWALSRNFEYVEVKNWKPLSGEARSNPLFASRLFLKGMGIPAETLESLQNLTILPDTDTVIVIDTTRYTQREQQLSELIEWVEDGGHLITRSISDWEFFDPDRSEVLPAEDAQGLYDESAADSQPNTETAPETDVATEESKISSDPLQQYLRVHTGESISFKQKDFEEIQFPGVEKKMKIASDYYQSIVADQDNDLSGLTQIKINGENIITQQVVGNGMITLVSDLSFIQNYSIDSYDHAEIFWYLVHGNTTSLSQPTAVWLIHSDKMPNLFQIIWKNFWPLCIMLGLIFLAWALRVSRRFGPLIPKDDEDRRNLMEHIEASGNYYWKQKQQATLVNSTRAALQQRIIQRFPGWQALNNDKQASLLAERLSMSEQHVLKLLHGDISQSPHEFTEIIKQLEHIRNTV